MITSDSVDNTRDRSFTPKPTSTPTPLPTSTPKPIIIPAYTCNCSKTCKYLSCAEAQHQLNVCGCSRRDRDKDGIACDNQCQ